jgi:hypothetical protein
MGILTKVLSVFSEDSLIFPLKMKCDFQNLHVFLVFAQPAGGHEQVVNNLFCYKQTNHRGLISINNIYQNKINYQKRLK